MTAASLIYEWGRTEILLQLSTVQRKLTCAFYSCVYSDASVEAILTNA